MNEAIINFKRPKWGKDEVLHYIRTEALREMFSPLRGGTANG
jgi:hypothetical protein